MKILIIGGTGILSKDVSKEAIKQGHEVYCINRGKHKELQNVESHVIYGDIRNKKDIIHKVGNLYFDVVVDFLSYTQNDLKNTLDIFYKKCDHYIFISSATAYKKKSEDEIITEETELGNTRWKYAEDKVKCENFLREFSLNNKINYTIIRPYVTYGNTRIPYAVIPNHSPYSWLNRIYTGKPVVLWDGGKAKCTLTNTKDFAIGVVGLFKNEKAYGEAFHITTDEVLTWKIATDEIMKAVNHQYKLIDLPTQYIVSVLPEYRGILLGDKSTNMVFDNSKIKKVVPNYECKIKFSDGIKETIDFINNNQFLQTIDFKWDARLDRLIAKYYHDNKIKYKKNELKCYCYGRKPTFKEKMKYTICRYDILYYSCNFMQLSIKKILKPIKKLIKKIIY